MKGVVIFDDKSDLAFFSLDKEMKKFILDRIRALDTEAGSDVDPGDIPKRDLRDSLSAFCLPFFTSFDVLQTLRKPIFSISVEDGFLIVFRKFDEQVYIALSKEDGDTEEILAKKLLVYNRIVTLLYGPVVSKLSSSDLLERRVVWERISALLRTYEKLYLTDQVFLLEAVEHVQFGQINTTSTVVQKLTKDIMESNHNGGLTGVRHAMVLVNTKVLSTYGRSPRLETADILLLNLLIYHHFHDQDEEEEEEEEVVEEGSGETEIQEESSNEPDGKRNEEEAPAEFRTPCSTPGGAARLLDRDYETIDDLDLAAPQETPVDRPKDNPPELLPPDTPKRTKKTPQAGRFSNKQRSTNKIKALLSYRNKKSSNPDDFPPTDTEPENKFLEHTVFLQPQKDQYIPQTVYCYQIYQNMVLLMVADVPGASYLAGNICQIIGHINSVFGSEKLSAATGPITFDLVEDAMRRLKDQVQKEATGISDATILEGLRIQTGGAIKAWKNLKGFNFREYLEKKPNERSKGPDWQRNFTRMDACACDLKDRLMKLFDVLYLSERKKDYNKSAVVAKLARVFASLNKDYSDFLVLKGEVNVPMVSYSMQFPGMAHFIYVDRSFDDLITPSLPTTAQVGNPYVEKAAAKNGESGTVFLRRKIWSMVQRVQRFLGQGYTVQTWLDEDFLYVYYLWINIPNNALGTPIRFYSLSSVKAGDYSQPGVIGSTFYLDVHNLKEGYTYELYAMFETKVSIKEASDHCRALAEHLWPSSRESVAPFSLIN